MARGAAREGGPVILGGGTPQGVHFVGLRRLPSVGRVGFRMWRFGAHSGDDQDAVSGALDGTARSYDTPVTDRATMCASVVKILSSMQTPTFRWQRKDRGAVE